MHRAFRFLTCIVPLLLALAAADASAATITDSAAVVHKPSVDVHSAPDFKAPTVATLRQNDPVKVAGQEGLWFKVSLPAGTSGYVRINDVRMASAKVEKGANTRALFTGKAGKGRVSETAGVRGIDESDLKSASFDAVQFARLESYRLSEKTASSDAKKSGWKSSTVAYATEAKATPGAKKGRATQAQKRGGLAIARGLLSALGGGNAATSSAADVADASAGKSEEELSAEELALGPEIAGRILGAAPLLADDAAQRRVNRVGRWVASQTNRPELPWTFGVIDSPEINAFAAPGGYILMTRGLYELLGSDEEVAAVLSHEISHVVQRDHYNVIRKQEQQSALQNVAAGQVTVGGGVAGSMAKDYVRRHGATVMLTSLDRDAEYRSDEAAEIYLARAGFNPMAFYAVLQKMAALGSSGGSLAQLYKTHPSLPDRMDRIDRRGYAGLERYTQRN
ncbi:M48 family metalloprotease [Lysobacter fragariae]